MLLLISFNCFYTIQQLNETLVLIDFFTDVIIINWFININSTNHKYEVL